LKRLHQLDETAPCTGGRAVEIVKAEEDRGEFASFLSENPDAGDVVPSKTKPMSPKELANFEPIRDLGADLLRSIREMKAGRVRLP